MRWVIVFNEWRVTQGTNKTEIYGDLFYLKYGKGTLLGNIAVKKLEPLFFFSLLYRLFDYTGYFPDRGEGERGINGTVRQAPSTGI